MTLELSNARPGFVLFVNADSVFALPPGHQPVGAARRLFALPENGPAGAAVEDLDGLLAAFFDDAGIALAFAVWEAADDQTLEGAREALLRAWADQVEVWA